MQNLKLGIMFLAIFGGLTESTSFAQMGGMGGGMGGMGGGAGRPKRKLHKPRAPALSPALNLLPESATTFEGQFLLRQLPQEQALREYQRTGKALDKLQEEVTDNDNKIKSGVRGGTGHRVKFMSYGGYYSYPGNSGGGR